MGKRFFSNVFLNLKVYICLWLGVSRIGAILGLCEAQIKVDENALGALLFFTNGIGDRRVIRLNFLDRGLRRGVVEDSVLIMENRHEADLI